MHHNSEIALAQLSKYMSLTVASLQTFFGESASNNMKSAHSRVGN